MKIINNHTTMLKKRQAISFLIFINLIKTVFITSLINYLMMKSNYIDFLSVDFSARESQQLSYETVLRGEIKTFFSSLVFTVMKIAGCFSLALLSFRFVLFYKLIKTLHPLHHQQRGEGQLTNDFSFRMLVC